MGVGGSKNKNDEQVPLIQKQLNDESEKNYYFPCILKIDYDSDKIELKTETDKTHELYIKDFLGDYTHIYNCSCSNCSKNNLNKIYYCNKCKKYICQDCLFNQEHPQQHLDECFIFIKSINICSKHDKVENILCKDCEKNVCSKCFDTFHKWHEKLENSEINKAIDIISLLSTDLFLSNKTKKKPNKPPSINTKVLMRIGLIIKNKLNDVPPSRFDEIDIIIEYDNNAKILSIAIIKSNVLTKSPLDPVCLMIIIIAAAAVDDAIEDKIRANGRLSLKIKYVRINTRILESNDSSIVMINTFIPFFFKMSNFKYSPVEKEMKASAISGKNCEPLITSSLTKLSLASIIPTIR